MGEPIQCKQYQYIHPIFEHSKKKTMKEKNYIKIMKREKYILMLNDGEEYLEIVSVGVSRPSKPKHYFKTGIKV